MILGREQARLQQEAEVHAQRVEKASELLDAVVKVNDAVASGALGLQELAAAERSLRLRFPEEWAAYSLASLALAKALPLFAGVFSGWNPLANPGFGAAELAPWRVVLVRAISRRKCLTTAKAARLCSQQLCAKLTRLSLAAAPATGEPRNRGVHLRRRGGGPLRPPARGDGAPAHPQRGGQRVGPAGPGAAAGAAGAVGRRAAARRARAAAGAIDFPEAWSQPRRTGLICLLRVVRICFPPLSPHAAPAPPPPPPLLPPQDYSVMPKLQAAVEAWDPRTETVAIHLWMHPWLPILGVRGGCLHPRRTHDMPPCLSDALLPRRELGKLTEGGAFPLRRSPAQSRLEPLFAPIRFKLGHALAAWHPSDGSALALLSPWQRVFAPGDWEALLVRCIAPKLGFALQELQINPAAQVLDPLQWALAWADDMPARHLAALLETAFFPKWLAVLHQWLSARPDYDEVTRWFLGWKGLFPESLLAHEKVRKGFNAALDLMNQVSRVVVEEAEQEKASHYAFVFWWTSFLAGCGFLQRVFC